MDPTGRNALDDFALLQAVFIQRTIPAVIAFVGENVTLQALPWIASTQNLAASLAAAATVFAVYAEDAGLTELAKGLFKLYVCGELVTTFMQMSIDLSNANIPSETKEEYLAWGDRLLIFACSEYGFRK
jgi:hypothetical protein